MIFWILAALAVAAVTLTFIYGAYWEGFVYGVLTAILAAILAACGALLLMLLLSIWFGPQHVHKGDTGHKLVALQTSNSVEGRSFFLGSGYIDGKRTLNYITDDDGAFRVESADADDSVVYQDSKSPTVTVHEWAWENPWFAPFALGGGQTFTFHIPEGSILSDYTINNR